MLLASVTPVIFCGVQKEEQTCVCSSACMAPQRKHVAFTVAAEAPNKPSQLVLGKIYPQSIMCLKAVSFFPTNTYRFTFQECRSCKFKAS